ncbi:TPA: Gfo/Idh/MocA family protein [Streptococcus suis]
MFGIIGLGGIYRDAYWESVAFLKKKDVIIYDVDKEALESALLLAEKSGCEYIAANSITEVFKKAEGICLFLPPKAIISVIKEGIDSKVELKTKKIYIEKPLGINFQEALEIYKLLTSVGIVLYYNEVFLHSSTTDVLVEELLTGRHGAIQSIEMNFNGSVPANITRQWRGKSETGGMVWHDWGIHSVGLLLGILKRLSIDYTKIDVDTIEVSNFLWQEINEDKVLVQSQANINIEDIDISILASWINKTDNEMRVYFCDGCYFEIVISKIDGTSSWNLFEVDIHGKRKLLTQSRYPKERFIRSLTAFIWGRNPEFTDYNLGVKAMEIVDYLLEKSKNI